MLLSRVSRCLVLALMLPFGLLRAQELFEGREVVPQEVLVKFRAGRQAEGLAHALAVLDVAESRGVGGTGALRLKSRSQAAAQLLRVLRNYPLVEYAEPNYVIRTTATPNDPRFGELWGLQRVQARSAWDMTTGSRGVVAGVLDSGVEYTHPDLAANMWSAPAAFAVNIGGVTINCPAGSRGFNAINRTCDPNDDQGHGTHVAGTIGAAGNNSNGVTGVNWNASMMALKMLDANGSGNTAQAVDAIEFALQAAQRFGAQANVRVLSASWAGAGFSQALLNEISLAGSRGVLFVAAAGNDGRSNDSTPMYPASYNADNIIAVAASDANDALAGFSNYGGASVDLSAPGTSILSTTRYGGYGSMQGTSMATPHVSGAALLVLSACNLSVPQLKANLLNNVDRVAALSGMTVSGGRLNVDRSVRACAVQPPPAAAVPVGTAVRLVARHSGKCLDVPNGDYRNGVRLQQWSCNGQTAQRFWLTPADNGAYRVLTGSGRAVDVANVSTASGAPVWQWEYLNGANQQWRLEPVGAAFRLVSVNSGKVLEVAGGTGATYDGAPVQQWDFVGSANQAWTISPVNDAPPAGVYQLVAKHSGKCLDVPGGRLPNGVRLQQWSCNGLAPQRFWLVPLGNGAYRVLTAGGKALDVAGFSTANGGAVQQWEYLDGGNQQWRVEAVGAGEYRLVSVLSGKVLEIGGGPGATFDGALAQQWDYVGGTNQAWVLRPVQ